MAEKNGLEFLRELRANKNDVPFFYLLETTEKK
jgi:DNA-binding response OmpR family regulator